MKYIYALKNDNIVLKEVDKETAAELEKEEVPTAVIRDKGKILSAYLLDFIDTDKYPVFRYYLQKCDNKAVVYLNDKDVYPVTVDGKQYYISDYSKIELVAFPEHQQYPALHTYLKVDSMCNTDSADKESVNPVPELMDNVLTNVYSELAKMKSDYDKGELPDSCLHFEEALKQLQRLKPWG